MYLSVQKIFKTSRLITGEPHGHDIACTCVRERSASSAFVTFKSEHIRALVFKWFSYDINERYEWYSCDLSITTDIIGARTLRTRAYLSNEMQILLSTGKYYKTSTCRCNLMCSSSISRCTDQMFPLPVIFLDRERGWCRARPAGSRTRLEYHIAGTVSSRGVSVLVLVFECW